MKQFRFYEKVAGILWLGSGLLGCGDRTSSEAPPPSEPAADVSSSQVEATGTAALLPLKAGGLSRSAVPRTFGPGNLYELINGGAEVFVEYGLVDMAVADYTDASRPGVTATVEVYDMGSPTGALGRAARNLASLVEPAKAGDGLPPELRDRGQLGNGDLWVWQGKHLLHVTLLDETSGAIPEATASLGQTLLPGIATDVLRGIPSLPAPPEISVFPADGLVPRSLARWPSHCLDERELGPCWSASYGSLEKPVTAFATDHISSNEAKFEGRSLLTSETCGRTLGVVWADGASAAEATALLKSLSAAPCLSPTP